MKTVCFLGDSITRRGYWIAEIFAHWSRQGIRVFNCGVSGDKAQNAIARLYTNCLYRSPDTVVMMFGMNDVGRDLYNEGQNDAKDKKAARIETYKASVRILAEKIRMAGADLILCTPTPYNDVTPTDLIPCHCNDGLAACAAFIRDFAQKIGAPCIDFFSYLRPLLGTAYLTLPDMVHPTPESHHPMAQFFMKEMGMIHEIDLTPFLPLSELEQARFNAEQNFLEIHFIEWNRMYSERISRHMTHADFINLAKSRLDAAEKAGDARQIQWYSHYLEIVENKWEYENELIRLTLEMAGS